MTRGGAFHHWPAARGRFCTRDAACSNAERGAGGVAAGALSLATLVVGHHDSLCRNSARYLPLIRLPPCAPVRVHSVGDRVYGVYRMCSPPSLPLPSHTHSSRSLPQDATTCRALQKGGGARPR